jgi:mono/diheme cytochrome c family protein
MTPRKAFYTISEGRHGAGMPAWKGALSAEEAWKLAAYVLSVARQGP